MSEIYLLLILFGIGCAAGILIGMLGIGGGIVFVPTLHFFLPQLGVPDSTLMHATIGTSLLSGALASSNSAIFHFKYKNTLPRKALLVGLGSVLTAFTAPFFVVKVKSEILEYIFASVLLIIAIRMFFNSDDQKKRFLKQPLKNYWLVVLGLFVGILSAFTGLGGGIIYVPALLLLFFVDTKNAVGTSSIITALTMISSALSFFIIGTYLSQFDGTTGLVQFDAAFALGIGAIIGSVSGVKLTLKSTSKIIRRIFSVVLILAVIRILWNMG